MATKIARGMAKVQFIANLETIKRKFQEGYNIKLIYNELQKENKFTGSYKCFSRYTHIYQLNEKKTQNKQVTKIITPSSNIIVGQSNNETQTLNTNKIQSNKKNESETITEKKTDKEKFENENKDLSDLA